MNNFLKKSAAVAALGISLSVFSPVAVNEAKAASSSEYAQNLVNSLKALGVNEVDYLYAYLQSIKLSQKEYNDIVKNAEEAAALLKTVSKPEQLSDANRATLGRLFLDSAQKAHLQVAFVDKNGNAFDLKNLTLENAKNLKIQLLDLKGNVLATIDPKKDDLDPAVLNSKLAALKAAIEAKKGLEKAKGFVPMPNSTLPNTASDLPEGIALGGLLIALGGLAFIPAMRTIRKMENQA
ncbi:cell wall anchor protein [Neobacillus niacini]|uniref:cell wall anchor protein n=1 Tax=Neobacillus niacini TaxID=86668 RepID=UPI0021CB1AC8|nr:cell wall anchor protein [Neobacillus niacini]MCM3763915.1 cell wall anchor protein [Neobacillus niacini]